MRETGTVNLIVWNLGTESASRQMNISVYVLSIKERQKLWIR